MTVVAFGTSTPELFVTLIAASGQPGHRRRQRRREQHLEHAADPRRDRTDRPLTVSRGTVWREMPFGLLASCALLFVAGDAVLDGPRRASLVAPTACCCSRSSRSFLYYSASTAQRVEGMEDLAPPRGRSLARALALVAAGLAGLTLGGQWIVEPAPWLSRRPSA